MAKRATLTYNKSWYTPVNIRNEIKSGNIKDIRKEYTRLRDIAQKRLKRLKAAGYANTDVYKKNYKHYPLLKDVKSENELAQRLSDLSRFIVAKRSTVSGFKSIKEKSLKTLHEHGYTFVTKENYEDFGQFMEEYRNQLLDMEYDSGEAADTFRVLQKHKIKVEMIRDNFEYWLKNRDIADTIRVSKADYGDPDALASKVERKKKMASKKRRKK